MIKLNVTFYPISLTVIVMNVKSRLVVVLFLLLSGCDFRYGLIESEFTLSTDSRLPKWVIIPKEYSRRNVTMTFTFYTHPLFDKVKMQVIGPPPEKKVLSVIIGDKTYHPITKDNSRAHYPRYLVISVAEMQEVFELRKMQPIIWITDNPTIISKMGPIN